MGNHKATPEQWAEVQHYQNLGASWSSVVLELRARIEALEAANRPRVITAEEVRPVVVPAQAEPPETGTRPAKGRVATPDDLLAIWNDTTGGIDATLRAIYDLGRQHGAAQ